MAADTMGQCFLSSSAHAQGQALFPANPTTHLHPPPTRKVGIPPASLPKLPRLAIILLFCSYHSNFKSDFDNVKIKVGLLN